MVIFLINIIHLLTCCFELHSNLLLADFLDPVTRKTIFPIRIMGDPLTNQLISMDVVMHARGNEAVVSFHPNTDHMISHRTASSGVKAKSSALHAAHQNGVLTDSKYRDEMRNDWLQDVYALIAQFGKMYVFPDIRFALNDVERALGEPLTEFEDDLPLFEF
jgi:hypothetical protein